MPRHPPRARRTAARHLPRPRGRRRPRAGGSGRHRGHEPQLRADRRRGLRRHLPAARVHGRDHGQRLGRRDRLRGPGRARDDHGAGPAWPPSELPGLADASTSTSSSNDARRPDRACRPQGGTSGPYQGGRAEPQPCRRSGEERSTWRSNTKVAACASVRYVARGDPERVTICHCAWCQRRTGSAFGTETVFRTEAVALADETLCKYRHVSDESGRWLINISAATAERTSV